MPIYDFACPSGHPDFEIRCSVASRENDLHRCPECGEPGHRVIVSAPHVCNVIIPMYPGSKAVSAGTVHSHGPKHATKTQSGPYGMTQKKEIDPYLKNLMQPEKTRNAGKT